MPRVNGKKFPYTAAGKKAAAAYRKSSQKRNSSDAIERKLDALTAAVLAMMERRGQGAQQTYRNFDYRDAFEYPSPQRFSDNLAGDTVMEGAITDYAADVTGGKNAMASEVAGRAGDKYMQDVYHLIMKNLAGNAKRGVR